MLSLRLLLTVLGAAVLSFVTIFVPGVWETYPMGRNVFFYYRTSSSGRNVDFSLTKTDLETVPITPESKVIVVVHGWSENVNKLWVVNITNALLALDPSFVILLLDYWDMTTLYLPHVRHRARLTADLTASMLDQLVELKGLRLNQTHMIGFSLGGRISGMVGSKLTKGKLARITGLDATYPWFPPQVPSEVLDTSDADLVVLVRTSSIGGYNPPAHVDFLPNGGELQPGCPHWYTAFIGTYYLPYWIEQLSCSHVRAPWIFVEAIELEASKKSAEVAIFPSCKCPDWYSYATNVCVCDVINTLGFSMDHGIQGQFFLKTNEKAPYARQLLQSHA